VAQRIASYVFAPFELGWDEGGGLSDGGVGGVVSKVFGKKAYIYI
jgi:hypothetical protein